MRNPTAAETREARILEAMIELGRDLMAARDEASNAASASGLSNETFQFLLGLSIGFGRALKTLQDKQQDALASQRKYLVALKQQGREFVIGRYATELEQMVAYDAARNAMSLVQADAIITAETVGQ